MTASAFWRGKRVFITGHTGFKGGWLTAWLAQLGAVIKGYGLKPDTKPNLFDALGLARRCEHVLGDVRNSSHLRRELRTFHPEIVFHLAAQPLVRRSYDEPVLTFDTNVMGTVNLLESCRNLAGLKAVICVTTDKCYQTKDRRLAYREIDPLGGRDPYSASKACAELAIAAYRESYGIMAASARAGNVIGGGDWSKDRLIPDAVRAFSRRRRLSVRFPKAVRPWQHVLEPLEGYLMLARSCHLKGGVYARAWNFGPPPDRQWSVQRVISQFKLHWPAAAWVRKECDGLKPEAVWLFLNSSLAEAKLGWRSRMGLREAIRWTADWYKAFYSGEEMWTVTQRQIDAFTQPRR